MFSYKFLISQILKNFPLKISCDNLWMKPIYSVKKHVQNTSKTLQKIK